MPPPPPNTAHHHHHHHQQQPTYFNTVLNDMSNQGNSSGSAGTGFKHAPPSPHTAAASGGTMTGSPSQAARYRVEREREREREREEKEEEYMRRSLQARGKDYNVGGGSGRGSVGGAGSSKSKAKTEGYEWEQRQRRDEAAAILESEEMIFWIAAGRNESVSQTRSHYRNILLGLEHHEAANVAWHDEWEVPQQQQRDGTGAQGGLASPGRSEGGKGKERDTARMRKRVSLGQGV